MKQISALVTVLLVVGVLALVLWVGAKNGGFQPQEGSVVTTIYPVEFLAEEIAGDHLEVVNTIPSGVEPHDYEPSPRDVTRVLAARVLIAVGGGLDEWVEEMADEVSESGAVVRVLDGELDFLVAEDHEDEREEEGVHHHEGMDPHFWTDPLMMIDAVTVITDALIEADPAHEADYVAQADILVRRLNALHDEYESGLAQCDQQDIIVSHDAFGYLGRRYGLNIHPIAGLSPEEEPSVRDLADLAEEAEELGVTTIFFETLVSPELAETLANEIGATTAVLNPLEGLTEEEILNGDDYFSIMEANLEALQTALVCQKE